MIRKSIALLLLASGLLLFFGEFQAEKKISKTNQEQIEKYFSMEDETPKENNYLGILEIPKINLKRGFYSYDSKENTVDKNIELLTSDCHPKDNCPFLLASHSGTSSIAFFKNLDQLKINDNATLYYEKETYQYELKEILHQEKNGTIKLKKPSTQELVLTTCNKNNQKLQDIYRFEIISTFSQR